MTDFIGAITSAAATGLVAAALMIVGLWLAARHRRRHRQARARRDLVDLLQAYYRLRVESLLEHEVARMCSEMLAHVKRAQAQLASCRPSVARRAHQLTQVIEGSRAWQGLSAAGHPASRSLLKHDQWDRLLVVTAPFPGADAFFGRALGGFLADHGPERVLARLDRRVRETEAQLERMGGNADARRLEEVSHLRALRDDARQRLGADGSLAWSHPDLLFEGAQAFLEEVFAEQLENLTMDQVARSILGSVGAMELIHWLHMAGQPPILLPRADLDLEQAHRLAVLELPSGADFLAEQARAATGIENVHLGDHDVVRLTTEVAGFSLRSVFEGEPTLRHALGRALKEAAQGRRSPLFVSPQVEEAVRSSSIPEALGIAIGEPKSPRQETETRTPQVVMPSPANPQMPAVEEADGDPQGSSSRCPQPEPELAGNVPQGESEDGGRNSGNAVERENRLLDGFPQLEPASEGGPGDGSSQDP